MSHRHALLACALLTLLDLGEAGNRQPTAVCGPIVPRREWKARASECAKRLSHPVRYVVVSHTAGSHCNTPELCEKQVQNVQHFHKQKGWCDVGYNFLIGEDGLVYEGRGWNIKGDHTGPTWNTRAIGISFMGNFMDRAPHPRALRAAQSLLACGQALGILSSNYEVKGHRDVQQTLSPGDRLYDIIQTWPHYRE
ncbi:peptidoglycan recognition protein 1-like [Ochotona curzoniae]|uniref:peptidoglycan recognition protein 1-like n=1 Tax=Ochotona curzoniae TaxID=130825 RepID=UPI001B3487F2|nr:peptidoglycan recognition protein 1-like [Ochotona curzoniae]XP_040852203.1 peptidoglycan recognition protein 1-like [Ochotona curzoniae]